MTRLFIRFYVGVLVVLFLAWYIHGAVVTRRANVETARVVQEAHGGGARLVAAELAAAAPECRDQALQSVRQRFDYPVEIIPHGDLAGSLQRRMANGDDVAYFRDDGESFIVSALSNGTEVVRLGPFPEYRLKGIEESIGGWMRLTADKFSATTLGERPGVMKRLREGFDFPIDITPRKDLPDWPKQRIDAGADVVFYPQANDRWFAATPLSNGAEVVRFGPFPSFERIEQRAAAATLALVLLPAALAIALLLRPVARQLRQVENAAKAIAVGDLSARVDERRLKSAKPLAQAFNNMASRTETLVRTQRELLQAVSHELRTPLARMRFAIDLIDTAQDDEERKQRLCALDTATEELDGLVGELLSYVRMETAQFEAHQEHVAVSDALEIAIPKYAELHAGIEFAVRDRPRVDQLVVLADRTGFQRVLGNLLSNAGRFAKRQVTVNAEASNGTITIDVDDDGRGIPASDRERVFEPFVRLEEKSHGHGRGVGLGLALVRRIVTRHGGRVEVLTSPLGGCRIRTTWPSAMIPEQASR
jgi:two-component system sensor histidine kinase RstB